MTRRDRLGRYPLTLDVDGIQVTLTAVNTDAIALHYPGQDGLCPICGVPLCAVRLGAVKALRGQGVRVPVLPPHEPTRPQWWCELCDCAWPCSQARVMLGDMWADDPGQPGLAVYLGRLLVDAARELPGAPARELATRFVGWVRY